MTTFTDGEVQSPRQEHYVLHHDTDFTGRTRVAGPSIQTIPANSTPNNQRSQTESVFTSHTDSVLSIDEPDWNTRSKTTSEPPTSFGVGLLSQPIDRSAEPNRATEQALSRYLALAAAVTTWCLLQPLIFFYVFGHFKNFHSSNHAARIAVPLCMLSTIAGTVLGPKAAFEVLRVTETGESPRRIRVKLYSLVLALTTLMALTPILLLFDTK